VQLLLQRGANKALKDDRGKTAADIARELGHKEVVAVLDAAA
jgi:ankyrin repeat protein